MQKIILTVVLLLAVSVTPAFADDASRCKEIINIQTQIAEINKFVRNAPQLDEVKYFQELKNLSESTDKIYDSVKGCDAYSDDLLAQMKGAINTLLAQAEKYRA